MAFLASTQHFTAKWVVTTAAVAHVAVTSNPIIYYTKVMQCNMTTFSQHQA